jgi:hypothetical protein
MLLFGGLGFGLRRLLSKLPTDLNSKKRNLRAASRQKNTTLYPCVLRSMSLNVWPSLKQRLGFSDGETTATDQVEFRCSALKNSSGAWSSGMISHLQSPKFCGLRRSRVRSAVHPSIFADSRSVFPPFRLFSYYLVIFCFSVSFFSLYYIQE